MVVISFDSLFTFNVKSICVESLADVFKHYIGIQFSDDFVEFIQSPQRHASLTWLLEAPD